MAALVGLPLEPSLAAEHARLEHVVDRRSTPQDRSAVHAAGVALWSDALTFRALDNVFTHLGYPISQPLL